MTAYCFVCDAPLDGIDDGTPRYCRDGCRRVQERAEARERAECLTTTPAGPDVPY